MSKYIDAEKLRKESKMLYSIHNFEPVEAYTQDQIDNAPAADVQEVRRGKWKLNQTDGGALGICSCCKWPVSWWSTSKFCPSCGAKMEVE